MPDPTGAAPFDTETDADGWGISIHYQPDAPYESRVGVARIDTERGEPHFDRLYEPDQPNEWLGREHTYRDARETLLSNWREYADRYLRTHGPDRRGAAGSACHRSPRLIPLHSCAPRDE